MFSDEFGISCNLARVMRNNFSKYSKNLRILCSEQKMKARDDKLSGKDFCVLEVLIKEFIEDEYNIDLKNVIKRVFNKDAKPTHINNMSGIEKIIEWIQTSFDWNSEFVISNNIYQNLVPIITGEDALGFDTRGLLLRKREKSTFYIMTFYY